MEKGSTALLDIVDQEFLNNLPDLGDDDEDAAMIDAAAYVSDSSEMSETDRMLKEKMDSDDDDWSDLTDFGNDSKATYIGPRYDYIDDMITKYVFADNEAHQSFVQKIKSTTGLVAPFTNRSLLTKDNRRFRELVQDVSETKIPDTIDTEPILSILYQGESATPAEQYFMQVAHPFLQDYTDPKKDMTNLEYVPDLLAFAFYVAFFSQARRNRTKGATKRVQPNVVFLLNQIYELACEKIAEISSIELKTFYEWCVYSKLALVFLSQETPNYLLAENYLQLALKKATQDTILSEEDKRKIVQCISNSQQALIDYFKYKTNPNSRLQLKKTIRNIWVHPDSHFTNPTSKPTFFALRFV